MTVDGLATTATLAVAGGKGGSGKTTATLGIAAALANRGRRPLAVDADVDLPDLHIRAGVAVEPGLTTSGCPLGSSAIRESDRFPGVDVLPAGAGDGTVEPVLSRVAGLDRPVLFDCPAGAGPDAAAPLRQADGTVVIRSDRPRSSAAARKSARMARALGAPPVARIRRTGDAVTESNRAASDPRVDVPAVDRRPLDTRSVLDAFDRVVRTIFEH